MLQNNKHRKRLNKIITMYEKGEVRLNLGCGEDTRESYINLDKEDINLEFPLSFKSNSVDTVLLNNVMQYIYDGTGLMEEIYRILKPNGRLIFIIIHFTNPYYHSALNQVRGGSFQMLCRFETDFKFRCLKKGYLFYKEKKFYNMLIENIANNFPVLYEFTPLKVFDCWEVYGVYEK